MSLESALSLGGDGLLVVLLGWLARRVMQDVADLRTQREQHDKRITALERARDDGQ